MTDEPAPTTVRDRLTAAGLSDERIEQHMNAGRVRVDGELATDLRLDEFELVQDGAPYREWCVPAKLLNRHATVRLLVDDE